jgi:serine/threonine-protein kinase RsbT
MIMMATDKLTNELGFDLAIVMKMKTVVSELAHNILKYAGVGFINLMPLESDRQRGIEICCTDRGPGIEDLEKALSDNFSTSGTLGLGLPGVKRLADEFEIDSAPDQGTKVTVRKWIPKK